jgi:hypothetical protein
VEPRGATKVEVTRTADAPPNTTCLNFCEKLAQCWLGLPNADPMVAPETAERRCLTEQQQCQRDIRDLHCCSKISDCGEFADCMNKSRNLPSSCG